MEKNNFTNFKPYFSYRENWGDLDKVQWWHIKHLFEIRLDLMQTGNDWPMIIHCCYEKTGHSKNSFHYQGCATDFHFQTNQEFEEQYKKLKITLQSLNLWNFVGLGVYPGWNNPGFHLDGRGWSLRWIKTNENYLYGEEKIFEYIKG